MVAWGGEEGTAGGAVGSVAVLCARVDATGAAWNTPIASIRAALVLALQIAREVVGANNGLVAEVTGNTLTAAFCDPAGAVSAAIDLQCELAANQAVAGCVKAAVLLHVAGPASSLGLPAEDEETTLRKAAELAVDLLRQVHAGFVLLTPQAEAATSGFFLAGMGVRQAGVARTATGRIPLWQLDLPGQDRVLTALREDAAGQAQLPGGRDLADREPGAVERLRQPTSQWASLPPVAVPGAAERLRSATASVPPPLAGAAIPADRLRAPAMAPREVVATGRLLPPVFAGRGRARNLPSFGAAIGWPGGAVVLLGLTYGIWSGIVSLPVGGSLAVVSRVALSPPAVFSVDSSARVTVPGWVESDVKPDSVTGDGSGLGTAPGTALGTAPGVTPDWAGPPDASVAVFLPSIAPPAATTPALLIRTAAERRGLDSARLERIAHCESELDPQAVNPHDGSLGLFQFQPGTWEEASPRAGYAGHSPFDPVANVEVAAYLMARGEYWRWTCQ